MSLVLSPPKIVLLAAHFTATGNVESLAALAAQHGSVLRRELLLRLLLTYLPASVKSADYVLFLAELEAGELGDTESESEPPQIDCSSVEGLTEEQAAKKVRKLRLRHLSSPDLPAAVAEDHFLSFLFLRAYAVDDEAGALAELPELLVPFLDRSPELQMWMISTVLPLLRRNCEYYPDYPIPHTLSAFERLPDRLAITNLLSQTGVRDETLAFIGRDLRGLVGPWLYSDRRWTSRNKGLGLSDSSASLEREKPAEPALCPGWEQVLQWLTTQALKSWRVAVTAVEQWDGPGDVDLGGYGTMWMDDTEQEYLEQRYARAALASAYLIPEASAEALSGANSINTKIMGLLDQDPSPPLQTAASLLSPVVGLSDSDILSPRNATYLRNDLLSESNILTAPSRAATTLLQALVLSAFILTKGGSPCSVRRAGELALLQSEREQKAEAAKLIHTMTSNGPKSDDKYWIRARNEILWLRDWGAEEAAPDAPAAQTGSGVFGQVNREFLEVEILKALLANTRYSLARSIYEDSPDQPLPKKVLQDTIFAAAMNAYDNASNPNRTRGGLKKCDDIVHAFPRTIEKSLVATQRIEALLRATHALSDYRLVLKQGEPFTPVVLRVHPDPISIVGKVLEQNPKSYTQIQELLGVGANMVSAGLTVRDKAGHAALTPEQEPAQLSVAERRITAMCIDAALTEDDFETAYSYVVSRLAAIAQPAAQKTVSSGGGGRHKAKSSSSLPNQQQQQQADNWSWKAALEAGKYRRTARTVRPTHLGTASGNPEIRHLEQRIECLATALRIAPVETLQEILNTYRRCEEELDAAVKAEAEQESAWDEAADSFQQGGGGMPGAFYSAGNSSTNLGRAEMGRTASTLAYSSGQAQRQSQSQQQQQQRGSAEEAPLSLFDLSRATARAARRNLTALSSLQRSGLSRSAGLSELSPTSSGEEQTREQGQGQGQGQGQARVRKRDQLAEAAMGTLTSGVGWLIGAQPVRERERERGERGGRGRDSF